MTGQHRPRLRQRNPGAAPQRSGPPPREETRTILTKALVNCWVDLATGSAFVLCAVTGIVLLFSGTVHTAIGATPTVLMILATWWHSVHDWTGIAMIAGTALHLALHAKWITTMTRRTLGSPTEAPPAPSARPARVAVDAESCVGGGACLPGAIALSA